MKSTGAPFLGRSGARHANGEPPGEEAQEPGGLAGEEAFGFKLKSAMGAVVVAQSPRFEGPRGRRKSTPPPQATTLPHGPVAEAPMSSYSVLQALWVQPPLSPKTQVSFASSPRQATAHTGSTNAGQQTPVQPGPMPIPASSPASPRSPPVATLIQASPHATKAFGSLASAAAPLAKPAVVKQPTSGVKRSTDGAPAASEAPLTSRLPQGLQTKNAEAVPSAEKAEHASKKVAPAPVGENAEPVLASASPDVPPTAPLPTALLASAQQPSASANARSAEAPPPTQRLAPPIPSEFVDLGNATIDMNKTEARISVETEAGSLSLHVRVRQGVTDISADGQGAAQLGGRSRDLEAYLAKEGLTLGQFSVENPRFDATTSDTESQHRGSPSRQDADEFDGTEHAGVMAERPVSGERQRVGGSGRVHVKA